MDNHKSKYSHPGSKGDKDSTLLWGIMIFFFVVAMLASVISLSAMFGYPV